jgi:para-aminobenzoate synthetase component 1
MKYTFQDRILLFRTLAHSFKYVYLLESNGYDDCYGRFSWVLLAGNTNTLTLDKDEETPWEKLKSFLKTTGITPIIPGFLTYDLKNNLENLSSNNSDLTDFPLLSFFEPEFIIGEDRAGNLIEFGNLDLEEKVQFDEKKAMAFDAIEMKSNLTEAQYTQYFNQLQNHISRGDIYEINYCMQFSAKVDDLDPVFVFQKLNERSPAPFAVLMKNEDVWLMGSSPERFLNKQGNTLISQPIKGTIRKTGDAELDKKAGVQLKNDQKERSENVMIVDLVRNDLTHYAKSGSVIVKELCEIYPFATVLHMISTIQAELEDETKGIDAIMKAFPMGSMTGAPKIRAMQLAEETETFRRGIYSGALGYFTPEGDFDFAVMIRSFTWNQTNGFLSFSTGSAITHKANAKAEYNECLLKAEALLQSLVQ